MIFLDFSEKFSKLISNQKQKLKMIWKSKKSQNIRFWNFWLNMIFLDFLHFQKVFKINFKSKTKVENDLEIKKIPKSDILEFLVKHDIFGLFKIFICSK
jgi:hypothetical protein